MANNDGKLKVRRGTKANWESPSGTNAGNLYTGQLGIIYRPDGSNNYNTKSPRLITGASAANGSDLSSPASYNPDNKANTPYLTPDPDIYTDTVLVNTTASNAVGLSVTGSTTGTPNTSPNPPTGMHSIGSGAYLRNIVVSTVDPSNAANYLEGTIWLKVSN